MSLFKPKRTRREAAIDREYDTFNQLDNLSFRGEWIDSNHRIYVRCNNTNLSLTVITIRVKMLLPNGDIVIQPLRLTVFTDGTTAENTYNVGIGWVISIVVTELPQTSLYGATFCIVDLFDIRNSTHEQSFISNWVSDPFHPSWPDTELLPMITDKGIVKWVYGTLPAAGAEILDTVPTNKRWRLLFARIELTTDGTAGTRNTFLSFTDGTSTTYDVGLIIQNLPSTTDAAALTLPPFDPALSIGDNITLLPTEFWFDGGHQIMTTTTTFAAGDQYSIAKYLVEEFPA